MQLEFVKVNIPGMERPQKTFTPEVFKYYFEIMGYSRKQFTTELGVNHRIFTRGLKAYYTPEHIERLRVKKIVRSNVGGRVKLWADKLADIEVFLPGFSKVFEDNIKDNPSIVMAEMVKLNDQFYKAKLAMRPIRTYINQSLSRLGEKRISIVANGLEAKVKFILDDLGLAYECQFKLGKYAYDFKVGETLIEVDGQYHEKGEGNDIVKTKKAIKSGYTLLRLTTDMIKKQPLKTRRCLAKLNP